MDTRDPTFDRSSAGLSGEVLSRVHVDAGETDPPSPRPPEIPPDPYRGSGAPPFMLPSYRRRRNVGRTYR